MTVLTDGIRPKAHSPEFRPYFEAVINSSTNLTEAKSRMGYDDPSSVRYHMRKFGIKAPNHWSPGPSPRPSARGPDFRAYFEEVITTTKGSQEAAERMGYASRYTVVHHMKRLGIKKPDGWQSRPSGYSPDFQQYFENVVNDCRSVTEATQKLGYSRPASVRYNMKRFGIKTPDRWYSQPDALRRPRDLGFRAYFEGVVKSSENAKEVMEKLHYTSPNSVWYQMKKQGIRTPDIWHGHPSARGPEFVPYFKNIVETSKDVGEAVQRIGYANNSIVYYHLRRLGIKAPLQWRMKPYVGLMRQEKVPEVILKTENDRAWVAALHQGEGCLTKHYSKKSDQTGLDLRIGMTDSAPIFKFCDLCGINRPKSSYPRPAPWKPVWLGVIGGLRAYRVLQEILPYLMGEKLNEAERALEFFAPDGYRKGKHGGNDVWPAREFPLRKRGRSRHTKSEEVERADGGGGLGSGTSAVAFRFDRTCLRIADVLLEASSDGLGLVEIMDRSGVSWTAAIHHLKHLEDNSFVSRERIHQKLGPRLLFRAIPRLVELRTSGWIPDSPGDTSRSA